MLYTFFFSAFTPGLDLSVSHRLCVPAILSLSPHYQASLICHRGIHHGTDARRSGRKEGWRQIAGDYSSTPPDLVPFFNRPARIRRLRCTPLIHVSRSHLQLARPPSHTVVCTKQNRADKTFKSAGLYLQDCICITIVYLCLKGL